MSATVEPGQLSPRAQEIVAAARELLERGRARGALDAPGRRAARHPRAVALQAPRPTSRRSRARVISTGFEEQAGAFEAALGRATTRCARWPPPTAASPARTRTSTG